MVKKKTYGTRQKSFATKTEYYRIKAASPMRFQIIAMIN